MNNSIDKISIVVTIILTVILFYYLFWIMLSLSIIASVFILYKIYKIVNDEVQYPR